MKTKTPNEAFEGLFSVNAWLIVDVGIDMFDGEHEGREQIESLLKKIQEIELQITNITIRTFPEQPNGTYSVRFSLGPKSIEANLTMDDTGEKILRGVIMLGRYKNIVCELVKK